MPTISISQQALQRYKTLIPGVYPVRCTDIGKGTKSKSGSGANVYKTLFETVSPSDVGLTNKDIKSDPGVEVTEYFNDNPDSAFRVVNFICAAKGVTQEELFTEGENAEINLETALGEFLLVDIYNEAFQGQMKNKIKAFYKVSETPF